MAAANAVSVWRTGSYSSELGLPTGAVFTQSEAVHIQLLIFQGRFEDKSLSGFRRHQHLGPYVQKEQSPSLKTQLQANGCVCIYMCVDIFTHTHSLTYV